ncbi:hypothetical protein, partial [Halochromatium sp.]
NPDPDWQKTHDGGRPALLLGEALRARFHQFLQSIAVALELFSQTLVAGNILDRTAQSFGMAGSVKHGFAANPNPNRRAPERDFQIHRTAASGAQGLFAGRLQPPLNRPR